MENFEQSTVPTDLSNKEIVSIKEADSNNELLGKDCAGLQGALLLDALMPEGGMTLDKERFQLLIIKDHLIDGKPFETQIITNGSKHERKAHWEKTEYKNFSEQKEAWISDTNRFFESYQNKEEEKILAELDMGIGKAGEVYDEYFGKDNGKGDIGYFASKVAKKLSYEDIRDHADLLKKIGGFYGKDSAEVAVILAQGERNLKENTTKFIPAAENGFNNLSEPDKNILKKAHERSDAWVNRKNEIREKESVKKEGDVPKTKPEEPKEPMIEAKQVVGEDREIVNISEEAKKAVENLKFLRDNWLTEEDQKKFKELQSKNSELDKLQVGFWSPVFNNQRIKELKNILSDGGYVALYAQKNLGSSNLAHSYDFFRDNFFNIDMEITQENIDRIQSTNSKSWFFYGNSLMKDNKDKTVLSNEIEKISQLNKKALDKKITNAEYVDEIIEVLKRRYTDLDSDKTNEGNYGLAPYVVAFLTAKMHLSLTSKDKIPLSEAKKNIEEVQGLITHFSDAIDPYRKKYLENQFIKLKSFILAEKATEQENQSETLNESEAEEKIEDEIRKKIEGLIFFDRNLSEQNKANEKKRFKINQYTSDYKKDYNEITQKIDKAISDGKVVTVPTKVKDLLPGDIVYEKASEEENSFISIFRKGITNGIYESNAIGMDHVLKSSDSKYYEKDDEDMELSKLEFVNKAQ